MAQAHPAFPSIPAPSERSTPKLPPIPSDSKDLCALITSHTSVQQVQETVLPVIYEIATGTGQDGKSPAAKAKKGMDLLTLPEFDISRLEDQEVVSMTAALFYVLLARLRVDKARGDGKDLLAAAIRLCNLGDAQQLRLCLDRAGDFAWGILSIAKDLKVMPSILQPLALLISRAVPGGVFSAAHAAYLECSLHSQSYDHAISLTEELFLDFRAARPTYLDILTFYHHAGRINAAVGRYARARDLFVVAVTMPTQNPSAIQLAAAKRAILSDLLDTGRLVHFPKYTAGNVTRMIERHTEPYLDLAKAYGARDWPRVRQIAARQVFADDYNLALVRNLVASIPKARVLEIKDAFSKITVGDLATRLELSGPDAIQQVENTLGQLVAEGRLKATVTPSSDAAKSIVTFEDGESPQDLAGKLQELKSINTLTTWLEAELRQASKTFGISEPYLKKYAEQHISHGKGKGSVGPLGGELQPQWGGEDGLPGATAPHAAGFRGLRSGGRVGNDLTDVGY